MKFLLAIIAHLVIPLGLGWGVLLAVKGEPCRLIAGFQTCAVAFAEPGCLPKTSY